MRLVLRGARSWRARRNIHHPLVYTHSHKPAHARSLDDGGLAHVPPLILAIKAVDACRSSGHATLSRALLTSALTGLDSRIPRMLDTGAVPNVSETLEKWLGIAAGECHLAAAQRAAAAPPPPASRRLSFHLPHAHRRARRMR